MSHIIVAFSKRENAASIRNILVRSGMDVSAVCLTGAAVLQNADTWDEGIVICGFRMQDMQYTSGWTALFPTEWSGFPCR